MRGQRRWMWTVTVLASGLLCAGAWAAGVDSAEPGQAMTLGELFDKGGSLMYVLSALSVIGVAMILYCFAVLRRETVLPASFRRDVLSRIGAGKWEEVRALCQDTPSPLSEIALAALEYSQAAPTLDATMLKEVVESEGTRQAGEIQGQTQYLLDVAVIAPMVGLLGTVFGMIKAFNVVALDLAKAKPMLLAAGVSEALITTAAGLIIGIPVMAFYAFFRGRAARLVSLLESAAGDILTAFLKARRS